MNRMEQVLPRGYLSFELNHNRNTKMLLTLGKVLLEYKHEGKTSNQFEEDYGCTLLLDDSGYGIKNVKFHNDSCKTAFMLKYSI